MILPLTLALMLWTPFLPSTAAASSVASVASGAPAASTSSFAARVLRGKMIEAGSTGPAYQKILWAQLDGPTTDALKACIRSNTPADKSPFTLVADVGRAGIPGAIEVRPATPVATCIATWFGTITLPPPPSLPDTSTYPLEIDFSITP